MATEAAAALAARAPLDTVKARAKAAVLGAIVADAATMPLHWIYDIEKMNTLLADAGRSAANPEFYPTPSCPFYNQDPAVPQHVLGGNSPYGEELLPLARSLEAKGGLDPDAYGDAMVEFFSGGPSYRNASVRKMLEHAGEGKKGIALGHPEDFQANCFAKVPLLVARYAGKPELLPMVEAAVRVQQNNDKAAAYGTAAASILERVVLGSSLDEALQWAAEPDSGISAEAARDVAAALATRSAPLRELTFTPAPYMADMMAKAMAQKDSLPPFTLAVWCNGPACGNPAAFTNAVMAAVHFGDSYADGVRANLVAGGDNCSRSCLVGALLAAQGGVDSIPEPWRGATDRYQEYDRIADGLVAHL